MRRRRLLLVALLLAAGAHGAFWYLPRVRSMPLSRSVLAPQVFATEGVEEAIWISYPHQNLGRLPEVGEVTAGLLTALGSPIVGLPRFGPFGIPPADELLLIRDASGARIELRLFPVVAGLARVAGWLAANPWLTGGSARAGARPVAVSWRGRTWRAGSGGGAAATHGYPPGGPKERAVAVLQLPASLFQRREVLLVNPRPGSLWLHPSGVEPAPELSVPADLAGRGLALAAFARARPISGVLVFDRPSGASGVPQIAALGEADAARRALPIKGMLGRELPRQDVPGGVAVALDRVSLQSALELEPLWGEWVAPAATGPSALLWIDPAAAAAAADRFEASDWLWLASRDELVRWQGAQRLLAGLGCWGHLAAAASADGRQILVSGERWRRCAR